MVSAEYRPWAKARQRLRTARRACLHVAVVLILCACAEQPAPSPAANQVTIKYPNGEVYIGDFHGGLRAGQGTYSWPDGRKYVGAFRDGFPNGRGTYTFPNGERYVGEFVDNRRTGQGTYSWPDGRKYIGEFRDDVPNGQGTYSWPDGHRQVGQFRNGEFVGDSDKLALAAFSGEQARVPGGGEIAMQRRGANYVVPGVINESQPLDFFLDSGSADVAVPAYIFDQLKRSGSVRDEDLQGRESYVMSNGQPRTSVTFRIRSLRLGSIVVENVRGTVMEYSGPALLGMSFLSRFRQWLVDNDRHVLILR